MVETLIVSLIEKFRSEVSGELADRNRVVDHLLDIRLAAADQPVVVIETDRLLRELPGLTIVPNAWWLTALDDLETRVSGPRLAHH